MFCSSLRRRKSVSSAIPVITANPGLNLKENQLDTHDLAIALPRLGSTDTVRTLRVLLLSPSCSASIDAELAGTVARIRRFAALNGGLDSIVIFVLDPDQQQPDSKVDGLAAFSRLGAALFTTEPTLSDIPLLPLTTIAAIEPLLKAYIQANSATRAAARARAQKPAVETFSTALELLPWCTADAAAGPLSRDHVFRLTDLFGSLRQMAAVAVGNSDDDGDEEKHEQDKAASRRSVMEDMVVLLGERTARDVLDFWIEEWVAD